jgi:hypothetical protein
MADHTTTTSTAQAGAFPPPAGHHGYFIAWRTDDFDDLIRDHPDAFRLLAYIARRARYREGISIEGLGRNECLLGKDAVARDLKLSPRSYRTAKNRLKATRLATFQSTNRGTVARLVDSRVFAASMPTTDKPTATQSDGTATNPRQTPDKPPTPKKQGNKVKQEYQEKREGPGNGDGRPSPKLSGAEIILRQDELQRVEKRMKGIADQLEAHMSFHDLPANDRAEFRTLKERREILKRMLGLYA